MPKRRRGKKLFISLLGILVLLAAGFALWVNHQLRTPHAHQSAETSVIIDRGLGVRAIADRLYNAGVISSKLPFLLCSKVRGNKHIKAGEYRFQSPITPLEVIHKMERGEIVQYHVTIPEGFNRYDISNRLAETGKADAQTFLRLTADPSLISDLDPQARDLEGYLFPDTYTYKYDTTPQDLVKMMTDRFRSVFNVGWRERADQTGSIHDAVTMASIIEKEAKNPDERPVIASVFYNRLKKNMLLETDPTFIYAAIIANDYDGNVNNPRHRTRRSPYNTYVYTGLPPGPIASPGRKSLEAALYPADTNFYYFVATGVDGGHHFSRSIDEHNRAVADYRHQIQQQHQQNQLTSVP
jgi:UPF0755 protein